MGFWHTGYMEFHEPVGLEFEIKLVSPTYPCMQCGQVFDSHEKLRFHRFEAHRHLRPTLYFRGREVGAKRLAVRSVVSEGDICIVNCDQVRLNGTVLSLSKLSSALSKVRSDVCRITLNGDGGEANFELDIQISLPSDLDGVDREFIRLAHGRRLDVRAIEGFITAARAFPSAMNYCDGICAYLYGVLAKEGAGECGIPYVEYLNRFNKASGELAGYDRTCARVIGALIEFHFNHFDEAVILVADGRVGNVAKAFTLWLKNPARPVRQMQPVDAGYFAVDSLVTDLDTERLLQWGTLPLEKLEPYVNEIELALEKTGNEFDRNKLHVLLAETYANVQRNNEAVNHAKALRSLAGFDQWSEFMIRHVLSDGA